MKSCDKKLRNKKNLRLFLAGSAMLLLASCSSAPAVLNNPVNVQNEVVKKVQPKCSVGDYSSDRLGFTVPFGGYVSDNGIVQDFTYADWEDSFLLYSCFAVWYDENSSSYLGSSLVHDGDDADEDNLTITIAKASILSNYSYILVNVENTDDTDLWWFLFPVSSTDSMVFEPETFTVNLDGEGLDGIANVYRNVVPPLGVTFVQDIVDILVSGITSLGSALGQGISTTAQAMFINASNDGLSVWGVLVASFAGLALAVGLTRLVFGFITFLGGKN